MVLKECPKCGNDTIELSTKIHLNFNISVNFKCYRIKKWGENKISAYCSYLTCTQKFWFYPKSGKITLQNK